MKRIDAASECENSVAVPAIFSPMDLAQRAGALSAVQHQGVMARLNALGIDPSVALSVPAKALSPFAIEPAVVMALRYLLILGESAVDSNLAQGPVTQSGEAPGVEPAAHGDNVEALIGAFLGGEVVDWTTIGDGELRHVLWRIQNRWRDQIVDGFVDKHAETLLNVVATEIASRSMRSR